MTETLFNRWERRMNSCISAASKYAELGCICQSVEYTVDAIYYATECCMASENVDDFQRFNEIRLELRSKMVQMAANLTHYPEVGKEVIQHLK